MEHRNYVVAVKMTRMNRSLFPLEGTNPHPFSGLYELLPHAPMDVSQSVPDLKRATGGMSKVIPAYIDAILILGNHLTK